MMVAREAIPFYSFLSDAMIHHKLLVSGAPGFGASTAGAATAYVAMGSFHQ
jgi:hypothetical protein